MDIKRLLNATAAGQIALNLDKQDDGGQDGKITKNIWDDFWAKHGGDEYKGRNENVGSEGVSVQDAVKLIMTRIFNAARKTGENVDALGNKWFNEMESHEKIDANTVNGITEPESESAGQTGEAASTAPANTRSSQAAKRKPQNQTYSTNDIKMTVKSTAPGKSEADKIKKAQEEGKQIAKKMHKDHILPGYLSEDNVAYALNVPNLSSEIDKLADVSIIYAYELLLEKHNSLFNDDQLDINKSKKSFAAMSKNKKVAELINVRSKIIKKENEITKSYNAAQKQLNQDYQTLQDYVNKANELLVNVANNPKQAKVSTENNNIKVAQLDNGQWIRVKYENNRISRIAISHIRSNQVKPDGTTYDGDEVTYQEDGVYIDTNANDSRFEYNITPSGYNFEKLKAIAEAIFGKPEQE